MLKLKNKSTKYYKGDVLLAGMVAALVLFGLIMIYSASYYVSLNKYGNTYHYLLDAAKWVVVGAAAFAFCAAYDYHKWRGWSLLLMIAGLILLIVVLTPLGTVINRASRWITIPGIGITIMPGEIIKFCLIVFVASYYSADPKKVKKIKYSLPILGLTILIAFLIYKQPNLSTAGLNVALVLGMIFVAGLPWLFIVVVLGAAVGGVSIAVLIPQGRYMLQRIIIGLNPWNDYLGAGYQPVQAQIALGSGGIFGRGLSHSIQKTMYLPEPMNDYILGIIGEELGLIGCICLMTAYLILIWRCCKVAMNAPDYFGMLLASGGAILLSVQVILNVAVVTGWFFPTGIFLPFISLGGNGTMIFMAIMGVIYNISRQIKPEESEEEMSDI